MKIPKLRGQYSDRNNISPISTQMQFDDLDRETRVFIRNILIVFLDSNVHNEYNEQDFLKAMYAFVFVEPIGNRIEYNRFICDIEEIIYEGKIYQIFDLLEGIYKYLNAGSVYQESLNIAFEKNYVGYRFIDGHVVNITSKEEINAINEATCINDKVSLHLDKAIVYLSNRGKPDYENSIKESISAVEAMCEVILEKKGTLGDLLTELYQNNKITHKALVDGYSKLYGYTSDAKGIRHAGDLDGPNASFDDAKYMLVSCSAFINYLKSITK